MTNYTYDQAGRLTQEDWMSGGSSIRTLTYVYPNWELLVAVDDQAPGWKSWAAVDPRIRFLPVTCGGSRGAELNVAWRHARGEWIGYFDAEAELSPQFLDIAAST